MQAALPRSWKEQFAIAAAMREEDILYREKTARFEAVQRQKTAERVGAAKRQEAEARTFLDTALAPPAKLEAVRVQLDKYDTHTVEALMENREALDRVRERLDSMLGKAHVLPDGRRVFKTMDGQSVYDENGLPLTRDLIDPALIDDRKPKWEVYRDDKQEWKKLNEERQGLLDYQARLDEARERLDGGDITEAELSNMQRDLREAMPDAVRRKAGLDAQEPDAAGPSASAPIMPVEMDTLMRQTGLGQPSAPGLR